MLQISSLLGGVTFTLISAVLRVWLVEDREDFQMLISLVQD